MTAILPAPRAPFAKARIAKLFKLSLTTAASIAALGLAAEAHAQSTATQGAAAPAQTNTPAAAAPTDDTVVVVRGVRASLDSAQKIKRHSDEIVDSVVAEDVGKLPDDNVAEALQRVTGIQITRSADEGQSVLIRGLPNVVTLLNGRDLFTTTGRYVALADVPAAFIKGVDVYKTNAADQMEGGIAGTIDVRMHRPFDFSGLEVSGTARDIYSSLSKAQDPNAAVLVSDRWHTGAGDVGALVGLSYQERHYRNEIIDNYLSMPLVGNNNWIGAGPTPNVFFPNNIGQQLIQGDRKRSAANLALQWKVNDDLTLYTEGFYTEDHIRSDILFFVGLPNNSPGAPFGGISSYTLFPGTNEAKTITTQNAFSIASTQAFNQDSQTYQFAGGGTWIHEKWKVTGDVASTISTYWNRNAILDTSFFTPNVSADVNHNGSGTPYLSYTGIDLTSPSNFDLLQLFDNYGRDHGQSTTGQLDANYTPSIEWLKSVSFGVRAEDRKAESQSTNPGSRGYPFQTIGTTSIPGLEEVTPTGFFKGDAAVGVTQWATPNPNFLLDDTDQLRALLGYSGEPAFDPSRYFNDDEKTFAAYIQGKAEFNFGGVPISGVGGVRFVNTKESLNGFNEVAVSGQATQITPLNTQRSDNDILPALNVKADLTDTIVARFGYSKTATRPDFSALNPAVSLSAPGPTIPGAGSGGNADLKEVKSDNYDLALEWYFAHTGSLTGTLFDRQIDGYIQYYGANEVFNNQTYLVTRPFNTGKGHLDGAEIGYTQFYDFLPGWMKGVGLQANLTFSEGVTHSPPADPINAPNVFGPDAPIVGLSKWSYNIIGLYERGPWSARIAYNWRSRSTDSYNNFPTAGSEQPSTVVVAPLGQLDMSFGYKVNDKLTLTLDWVNANDSIYHDSFGGDSTNFPRDTRRYDETVELGLRWHM